jgi:hypothetical protein
MKGRNDMKSRGFVWIALVALLLAACNPVSLEDATAQYCQDLEDFQAAVDGLRALTTDSSVEETEAALAAVDDAYDDLARSADILEEAQIDNLDQAYEDLDDAIRDIEGTDTLGEAAASLSTQVDAVDAAWEELYSQSCPE